EIGQGPLDPALLLERRRDPAAVLGVVAEGVASHPAQEGLVSVGADFVGLVVAVGPAQILHRKTAQLRQHPIVNLVEPGPSLGRTLATMELAQALVQLVEATLLW